MTSLVFYVCAGYLLFLLLRPMVRHVVAGIASQFQICKLLSRDWMPIQEVCRLALCACEEKPHSALAYKLKDSRPEWEVRTASHGVVFRGVAERYDAYITTAWLSEYRHLLAPLPQEEQVRYEDYAEWASNVIATRVGESWEERVRRLGLVYAEQQCNAPLDAYRHQEINPDTHPNEYMTALESDVQLCLCKKVTFLRLQSPVTKNLVGEDEHNATE